MTDPSDARIAHFNGVMAAIREPAKASGYRRRGTQFIKQVGEDWRILQVQRFTHHLRGSDGPGSTSLTINLGIWVGSIARVMGESPSGAPLPAGAPMEPECHSRQRIGHLMPQRDDTWWPLDDPETPTAVAQATEAYGFRHLDQLGDHRALLEFWLDPASLTWLGEPVRVFHCAVLAAELGHAQAESLFRRLEAIGTMDPRFKDYAVRFDLLRH